MTTAVPAGEQAERIRGLPFHREECHLATGRLIVVAALAGGWDETIALADRFREGMGAGRTATRGQSQPQRLCGATVEGLRGNDDVRAAWRDIVEAVATPGWPLSQAHFGEFFYALLLHQGLPERAMRQLDTPPERFRGWYNGMWRPWYADLWAEEAVVAGHDAAVDRIRRTRLMTLDNPIAAAIVDQAAALLGGDRDGLAPAAAALETAGTP
jgi:hypothetical protein